MVGQYSWSKAEPARLLEHSKAKHAIYREYLRRYVRERTQSILISRLTLNVVDGFAGGGVYMPETGNEVVYGSPIIFLEVMREMQIEAQARRKNPFLLDYRLHLVDQSPKAHASLMPTLRERGFGDLIGNRVYLHQKTFQEALPSLLADVGGRGSTIFVLDQFGYTDVPFGLLRSIFERLSKPEIILTFAYDQLVTWVQQYDKLNKALKSLGVGAIRREEYEEAMKIGGGREFFIQRTLSKAFLSFADYFTPFFIMSRGSNMAYWLVHLSVHAKAKHVMQRLHWELQNSFAHFGGVSYNMLGYDPNNAITGTQSYLFDDDAMTRTLWQMQTDLPKIIHGYPDGVELWKLFSDTANDAPGDAEVLKTAVISLAEMGGLEVRTQAGGEKRSLATIKLTDRIRIPQQPTFFLPGRPVPLFARQPNHLVGPPQAKKATTG